ncbi:hypothetical protein SmJEL517_g01033 [Synchytrium microbalum]|uniref:C1q domain-containing protein n=1 Tax=Synchytrium microbalum TaxID=1806994 RepID=A0A507CBZ8_9FUNG|nr:uncharacterized protein SmJEL517_g01033 [Synchytrium microbalum]TPX37142.1 hypothetical protein SmJEL517_g01033 [Synchytrium microbalum]
MDPSRYPLQNINTSSTYYAALPNPHRPASPSAATPFVPPSSIHQPYNNMINNKTPGMEAVLSALQEQAEAVKSLQAAMLAMENASSSPIRATARTNNIVKEGGIDGGRRVGELDAELRKLRGLSPSREPTPKLPNDNVMTPAMLAAIDAAVAARLPLLVEKAQKQLRDDISRLNSSGAVNTSGMARYDRERLHGLVHDEVSVQLAKKLPMEITTRIETAVFPQIEHLLETCRVLQKSVLAKPDKDEVHYDISTSISKTLAALDKRESQIEAEILQQVSHKVNGKIETMTQLHQSSLDHKLEVFSKQLETFKSEMVALSHENEESHARVLSGLHDVSGIALHEPKIKQMIRDGLDESVTDLRKVISQKVDHAVLEELMRHIASREELRAMLDKKLHTSSGGAEDGISSVVKIFESKLSAFRKELSSKSKKASEIHTEAAKRDITDGILQHVHNDLRAMFSTCTDEIMGSVRNDVDLKLIGLKRDMIERFGRRTSPNTSILPETNHHHHPNNSEPITNAGPGVPIADILANEERHRNQEERVRCELRQFIIKSLEQHYTDLMREADGKITSLRREVLDALRKSPQGGAISNSNNNGGEVHVVDMENAVKSITRDFDEKLYLVCSDVSAVKSAQEQILRRPLHRVAQWLWKSQTLKFGSAVPWNYQSVNTDPDNFTWTSDSPHIRVHDGGLYEISFAFFTKAKPSIQLVVNGESVLSAINSASYVVHHGSGFVVSGEGAMEPGVVSGLSLLDFLALPPKSTLSLHYHGAKKQILGHGFFNLRRLY